MPLISLEELAGALPAAAPLIGLDLGTRTIGIAVSDRLRKVASARTVLRRTRFQKDARALIELATGEAAAGIVIGLPAYEVADAIARRDLDELRRELGDLLLQVVYH